jgi:hypothetical protein
MGKLKYSENTTNPIWTFLGLNLGLHCEVPVADCPSCGKLCCHYLLICLNIDIDNVWQLGEGKGI